MVELGFTCYLSLRIDVFIRVRKVLEVVVSGQGRVVQSGTYEPWV